MDLTPYQSYWKPGVDRVRAAAVDAREIVVFLHLAKTGGSSLCAAMENTPLWTFVQFPEPHRGISFGCSCGTAECAPGHIFDLSIPPDLKEEVSGRGLFVNTSHVTYELAEWLSQSISLQGNRARMVTTVRPARRRAISYFRDYWEQVSNAHLPVEQVYTDFADRADAARLRADADFYLEDSRHYLDADGRIDGNSWLESQVLNAQGFPFLLRDVFGHPAALERAITIDSMVVIPISEIDVNLERVGIDPPERRRVSSPPTQRLADAIEEAVQVLDRIVDEESEFDRVLANHLGHERFPAEY